MKSSEERMQNIKQWLQDTADTPLEEMSDFFTKRLHDYEEHMSVWEKSYEIFAGLLPSECRRKQGCRVTHFDISRPMIEKARELAEREGVLDRITFVNGALEELKDFRDKSFDMVISFDAPVSYTWPNQERVIGELIRICRKRIIRQAPEHMQGLFRMNCL